MISAIPRLGSRKVKGTPTDQALINLTHIAIPVQDSKIQIEVKWKKFLERRLAIDLDKEIKAAKEFTGKAGEVIEVKSNTEPLKILLSGVGEGKSADLRKLGASLGRKIKGSSATVLSLCPQDEQQALVHLNALALSNYTWNLKSSKKSESIEFLVSDEFKRAVTHSQVLVETTWQARDLIHTPSNIKSPKWVAAQARKLAKENRLGISVKSGREIAKFGGLRAVGNSSKKNPPCFVEISYKPKKSGTKTKRLPHVVLVGKGITFDTGGVSLKRPYDMMTAMKTDMAGAAAVLLATVAAAKLNLNIRVTTLLMLAENALSATAQRPSDVIEHFDGTTVEVINTDAEGRLVLADGLAYADLKLSPDYLVDVATLTGAATLGLSRHFAALYTRDDVMAKKFNEIGEYTGDRIWQMPLVDDYAIALESEIADLNHTADKYDFEAGSVTAALFLERFAGKRRWFHLDIAGPARSEADSGENPKGGTGYGVRLLTEWMAQL
ncbi:MAG: leucyl aminopeptidase family protein [Actinomycetota bacterium]